MNKRTIKIISLILSVAMILSILPINTAFAQASQTQQQSKVSFEGETAPLVEPTPSQSPSPEPSDTVQLSPKPSDTVQPEPSPSTMPSSIPLPSPSQSPTQSATSQKVQTSVALQSLVDSNRYLTDEALESLQTLSWDENKYIDVNDNRTKSLKLFASPVKFKDSDGKYKNIDNSIVATDDQHVYKNKASDMEVLISDNLDQCDAIEVNYQGYSIGFKPLNTVKENGQSKASINFVNNGKSENKDRSLDSSKKYNSVEYTNTFNDNTNITISPTASGVKENIVLNQIPNEKEFSYEFTVKNVVPLLRQDGNIYFIDLNKGLLVAAIPSPYMYDSAEEYIESYEISVKLEQTGDNTYKYTLIPDRKFLEDNNTVYPVIIDPSITTLDSGGAIVDTFISSRYSGNNYCNDENLKVGYGSALYISRGLVKITSLPSVLEGSDISEVTYNAYQNYEGASSPTMDLVRISSLWDVTAVKWSNKPNLGSLIDQLTVHEIGLYTWDVSDAWDDDSLIGNGMYIKIHNEALNQYKRFYSVNGSANPNYFEFTYEDQEAPTAPADFRATSITGSSVSLAWTASTDNIGVTGYTIYRDENSIGTTSNTSYTDYVQTAGYTYTVTAYDAANNESDPSDELVIEDQSRPTTPTNLSTTSVTSSSVSLLWTASTDDVGVTGYTVLRDGEEVGTTSNTSYTDYVQIAGVSYTYTVKAFDAAGNESDESDDLVVLDQQAPTAPTNLSATSVTGTSVSLSWTASNDNIGVTGYTIYRDGDEVGTSTSNSFTDSSVSDATSYAYKVTAQDGSDNSSTDSNIVNVATPDITAPMAPESLEASSVNNTQLTLTWTTPEDNVGVAGYIVYRDNVQIGTTANTTYTDTGLDADTMYIYTIKAKDAANNISDPSNELNVTTSNTFAYTVNSNNTITINDYTGSDNNIIIPAAIAGKTVTAIAAYAFWGRTSFSSVSLPSTLTSIGDYAFASCTGLTSFSIPSSVSSFGEGILCNCSSLTSVTLPSNITSLSKGLLYHCSSLTSLTMPNSVTSIGDDAFTGCTSLTSITLPNSIASIGDYAFFGCSGLTSITLPNTLTSIGDYAFTLCNNITSATIPASVTSMGESVFSGCSSLTSVTLPSGITILSTGMFYHCSSLTSIIIPSGVTSIGNDVFISCVGLSSVSIPSGVTSIGTNAFRGCTGLTSITIPNGVTSIGDYAFACCTDLSSASIPGTVTSIGDFTFWGCTSLYVTSPTTPTNLTATSVKDTTVSMSWTASTSSLYISGYDIYRDSTLIGSATGTTYTDTNLGAGTNYSYTVVAKDAAGNVSGNSNQITPTTTISVYYDMNTYGTWTITGYDENDPDLIIPATISDVAVVSIENYAFWECDTLESVTIPDSVTWIGEYAFYNCTNLTSINTGNGAATIGEGAFSACASLSNVVLPNNLTDIESFLFSSCTSLTSLTIPTSVTSVGYKAFKGCTGLTSLTIPNGVTSIGGWAFYNCTNLANISLPDSVTNIEEYAFYYCTALTNVTMPDELTSIGEGAFARCTSFTNIVIPDSVISIGPYAFYACSNLENIYIPETVTNIGSDVFDNCPNLTQKVVSSGIKNYQDFTGFGTQSGDGYVNPATGNLIYTTADLSVASPAGALAFARTYNSQSSVDSGLGKGWDYNYNITAAKIFDSGQETGALVRFGDGSAYRFTKDQYGIYTSPAGLYATLAFDSQTNKFTLTFVNKTVYLFNTDNRIESITDRNGNTLQFTYNATTGYLESVEDNLGNEITITYSTVTGESGLIKTVAGNSKTYNYIYTSNRKLSQVYILNGSVQVGESYAYTGKVLTTVTNPNGQPYLIAYNTDPLRKATSVTDPLGQEETFAYSTYSGDLLLTTVLNYTTQKYYYDSATYALKKTKFESEDPTIFTLDSNFNVTQITYPDSTDESYTYDSNGCALIFTNKASKTTTYVYDDTNNPDLATQITEPFNGANTKVTVNTYDTHGNLTGTYVQGINQAASYTYNSYGEALTNTVTITDGSNTYTTETDYEYSTLGRLTETTVVGASNSVTSQTYDAYGYVEMVTDPKGIVTKNYNNILGQTTQQTSAFETANAANTYSSYDKMGNKLSETDAEGNTTSYTYDALGRQTRVSYQNGAFETTSYAVNSNGTQVQTHYDAAGDKTITVTDKKGQATVTGSAEGVTDTSNSTTTGNRYIYGGDVLIEYTLTTYDVMGNATETTDNTGLVTENTYDSLGQVTESETTNGSLSTTTEYTYDDAGNKLTETTPAATTTTTYDKLSRPLTVITSKNGSSSTTEYTYDGVYNGKLKAVIKDPLERETIKYYDIKGQLAKETYQDRTTEYTYDGNGNMLTSTLTDTNFTGQSAETVYTYDSHNRKESVTYSEDDQYVLYTYDDNGNVTLERLYKNDTLASSTGYTYDTSNRVTQITRDNVVTAIYTYTTDGAVASVQYGSNSGDRKIGYEYDDAGKLTAVKEIIGEGSTPIRTYYYKDGRLDYLVDARGTDDAKQAFVYDSLNRLTSVEYYDTDDVTVLEEYDIAYNTKDQITDEDTTIRYGSTPVTTAKDYTYDNLGRMISETVNSVETDYTYDAVGNRTSMTTGGTTLHYDYNDYDQLMDIQDVSDPENPVTMATYDYDLSGNQISKTDGDTVTTYAYDDANWLTYVTQQVGQGTPTTLASFAYDASGQRTQKAAGSNVTNYSYSGLHLLYTKDGNGDIIEQNILEPDGSIIDSRRASNSDYWYRQDIRGSVTNIVSVDDSLVKSYTYDAYGNTSNAGAFINSFAYTGAVIDTETGLYYMNARYYDPETGRFISQDSYRGSGDAFWHLYAYCDGDPVNATDPTGHTYAVNIYIGGTFGHSDILLDAKICSYGRYDSSSVKSLGTTGDGVFLMVYDIERYYLQQKSEGKKITQFELKLTSKEKYAIWDFYNKLSRSSKKWENKTWNVKYKFRSGHKYHTYFLLGPNCTTVIMDALKAAYGSSLNKWKTTYKYIRYASGFKASFMPGELYTWLNYDYMNKQVYVKAKKTI